MIAFRESLYRVAHHGCAGYKLYSQRLDWWFPIQGRTLRTTGHYSELPYFQLVSPFERPMVPIDDTYDLYFCEPTGNEIQSIPVSQVNISTPMPLRQLHPQLKERIDLYLAEQGFRELGPALRRPKARGLLGR
ncbi:hypothetical protein BVG81_003200 [Haliangium sp. UPWRP_2]|nr:hypothetical protein BVG81_003200 [Haliangium sp. UPWRP_2]